MKALLEGMAIILTFSEPLSPQAAMLRRFHKEFPALKNVFTQRIARVEVREELSTKEENTLHNLLLNGKGERAKGFEIAYQPAITDPEDPAIQKILKTTKFYEKIQKVKLSTLYHFEGLHEHEAKELVKKYLFNELQHVLIHEEPKSLTIDSKAQASEIINGFIHLDHKALQELSEKRSLYMEEYAIQEVQRFFRDELKRDPTDAELEYLAQRTSDHCFHTTWKSLGLFKVLKESVEKILPFRKDIVSVFVDNAGVMEASDGLTYLLKGETHNSPTAIAPVGGVETMHGGCIRDIMGTGQGGFPTMATEVFIVGTQKKETLQKDYEVDQFLDPLVILRGAVQGVQNYGNAMGIPNFSGRVLLHPGFFGKPLALGICCGISQKEFSKKGSPKSGDIAILIGSPTGRDGIHGATMSSAAGSEQMIKKEGAAVQIGDPYTERLIMEATPELRPFLRAYGDLGAGGIASCFGEMAEEVGIELDLEKIPTKYEGLSPWEKLESESQERMGMAVAPEHLEVIKSILQKHEIPFCVLGTFTDSKRFVVRHGSETIVDLPYQWLKHFPIPQKKVDQYFPEKKEVHLSENLEFESSLLKLFSHPNLADQSLFLRRWDSTVQGRSMRESLAPFTNMPYDQGIFVPDPKKVITQVLSHTINPWWSGSPENMAKACVIGAVSKQIAAGVKREKIVLCDNFYTPKSRKEIDYHLSEMVRIITDLSIDLKTPLISGKDSSSGTTKIKRKKDSEIELFEVPPTLCMTALGMGEDSALVPPKAFQKPGNKLFLIPAGISNDASGSVLLSDHERGKQFNYEVDVKNYLETIDRLSILIGEKKIASISVIDEGGIIHRIFEMILGSNDLGVSLELDQKNPLEFLTKVLAGSFIVEVEDEKNLEGLNTISLGKITEKREFIIHNQALNFEKIEEVWEKSWYDILQLPFDHQVITAPIKKTIYTPSKLPKKKVNVVYTPGINCHQEMLRAWEILGCDVKLISVTNRNARFIDADLVIFPGGFADGDYLGAAKVWHQVMETYFKDQMEYLRSGVIPVLGICNGFQLMTRAGFFGEGLRLTFNESGVFEQRWVRVRFLEEAKNSPWTKGLEGKEICVPVAHGEGRFVMDKAMEKSTIALAYHPNRYPNNPNGSAQGIAGVFAGDRGQFFGAMPHPERAIEKFHFNQDGLLFFETILKNLS